MAVEPTPTLPASTNLSKDPRSRPLLVRPGAAFDCFGDGLCCTDIHALGPVTRKEKQEVELLEPGSLVRHKDLMAPVFRTQESGACVLRSQRGCELHARHGAQAKPVGCARFPFGLVATPEGGRVTTEHRCPCRSMGERPAITPENALPSLLDAAGRLSPNGRVGPRIPLGAGRYVGFARFLEIERMLFPLLTSTDVDPVRALDAKPFGKLDGERWSEISKLMRQEQDGTAYGEAMVWMANAIDARDGGSSLELGARPWSAAFDRAEARSKKRGSEEVLRDWLADLLWSMDWVFSMGSFHAGRRELATVYTLAKSITERLVRARVRTDRAAAEAITVVELARQSEAWERVQKAL
ncbi:MAG: hypothetical protein QM778_13890 [Myxococcales bacterium]